VTPPPPALNPSATPLPFRDALFAMLGIGLVNMLVALDQTVVSTALPSIVAELQGFQFYAWIASAYLLASVVTVPVFGRLGDYFGRKRFVIAAVLVFTGASVLCGLATDMRMLAIARALQGIGGGMMVGTAFASIPDLFPDPHARVRWQVVMAAAYGIGTAAGPSLGGWLSQHFGWRSTFFVNLPVGALALYFIWRHLPYYRRERQGAVKIDWTGALLVALVLGGFQTLIEALPKDGLTTGNLALAGAVAVLAAALLICERRATHPIVPLDLFRDPQLVTLFTLSTLSGFVMFSLIFFAPLLLQGGFGLSPRDAGLVVTPLVVFITIGSIVNGRIVTRVRNPNTMLYVGFTLVALACSGTVLATRTMPHAVLMAFMMAGGLGLGFVLPNLTVFAQQTAGREHLGIATALLQSLRMIGGMIGTAFTGTLVTRMYEHGVRDALATDRATAWIARFRDPQILVNIDAQRALARELAVRGFDGAALLEASREALVAAIHAGIAVATVVAVFSIWQCRRVPRIKITRAAEPVPAAE